MENAAVLCHYERAKCLLHVVDLVRFHFLTKVLASPRQSGLENDLNNYQGDYIIPKLLYPFLKIQLYYGLNSCRYLDPDSPPTILFFLPQRCFGG